MVDASTLFSCLYGGHELCVILRCENVTIANKQRSSSQNQKLQKIEYETGNWFGEWVTLITIHHLMMKSFASFRGRQSDSVHVFLLIKKKKKTQPKYFGASMIFSHWSTDIYTSELFIYFLSL